MANQKGAIPKLHAELLFRRSPKTPRIPPKVNPVGSTQSTSNQSSVSTLGNTSVYLCQLCGIADDVQKIHCDEYTSWYHFTCAHVSNEVMLQETWLCPPYKATTLAIPASNVANIEGDKPTQQSIIQPPTVASGTYSTDVTNNSDKSGSATSSTSQITTLSINANAEPQSTHVQSIEHPLLVPATSTAFDLNTGALEHMRNPHLMKSIIGKLPSQHQLNWAFYQASIVNANISHLGDWLYRIAEVTSRVVRVTNNNKNSNSNKSNPFINSQAETESVSKLAILDVMPPNEEQDVKVNQMESLNGGKNVVQQSKDVNTDPIRLKYCQMN